MKEVKARTSNKVIYSEVDISTGTKNSGPQMNVLVEIVLSDGFLRQKVVCLRHVYTNMGEAFKECCNILGIIPVEDSIWYGIGRYEQRWFRPVNEITPAIAKFSKLRITGAMLGC